jgi:Ca-activated chloride channel family protein
MKKFLSSYEITKKVIIISLFTLIINTSFGGGWLWIQNPHWTNNSQVISGQGTIESATFTINPKGLYFECIMDIEFSSRGLDFNPSDTLEVSYDFNLPTGSIITDSYLWIEDSLVQARLMDRWTATAIYEGIVKRRRDPSILYKLYDDTYYLRIYPLRPNEKRKAIIKFLLPVTWTKKYALTTLPTDILGCSKNKLEKVKIIALENNEWKNPRMVDIPGAIFADKKNEKEENIKQIVIKHTGDYYLPTKIGYDSPMKDGIYLNTYKSGNEGFFQFAFMPSSLIKESKPKKIVFALDYWKSNSDINKLILIKQLASYINEYFNDNDKFKFVYYDGTQAISLSNEWIKADEININYYLSSSNLISYADTSNLTEVIRKSVKIANEDSDVIVCVISNSFSIKSYNEADSLVNKLKSEFEKLPPISSMYCGTQYYYYYFDGLYFIRYYTTYFLDKLARLTGGNYVSLRWNSDYSTLFTQMFQSFDNIINSFDIYTTVYNGFTYSKYNINDNNVIYLNKPIVQVGKFYGDAPIKIRVSAIYNDQLIIKEYNKEIPYNEDSTIVQIWTDNRIRELENDYTNYHSTSEVVKLSLKTRVLSLYTAFLALEPGFIYELPQNTNTGGIRVDSWGGGIAYALNENSVDKTSSNIYYSSNGTWYVEGEYNDGQGNKIDENIINKVTVYPNPFKDIVNINFEIPEYIDYNEINIKILNISGATVSMPLITNCSNNKINIKWDGTDNNGESLPSGMYFVVISANNFIKTCKILKR